MGAAGGSSSRAGIIAPVLRMVALLFHLWGFIEIGHIYPEEGTKSSG